MARRNFFDIISSVGFNANDEYDRLNYLFSEEESIPQRYYAITLKSYINDKYFRLLPFRGTCTDIDDMLARLQNTGYSTPLERLFVFCEFLIAVLPDEQTKNNSYAHEQSCTILQNIMAILEQTNHELSRLSNSQLIITEKNPSATQAIELVEDDAVALGLLEYNHFVLKGNLEEKRRILVSIGRYLEPLLRSRKLQNAGFKQLESDMGFMLNNFHIRHNNKEGQKAQEYIQKVNDSILEEWYDKAYNTALAAIIVGTQIDICADLDALKRTYTWKS